LPTSELASAPGHSKPRPPPLAAAEAPVARETPSAAADVQPDPAPTADAARSAVPAGPKARTAVRVSVEVLSKKSGTLLVRLLGEDDDPPANAHEALLVPFAPDVDLRSL
jgi:hypothetical protein